MLTSENVRIITSRGASCFVCDERISSGEKSLQVTFHLLVPVSKEMHPTTCAKELRDLLDLRIQEAR